MAKKLKTWIVSFHKKGDLTDLRTENIRAKSRKDLEKQAKKRGIVIDMARLG